MKLKNKVAVVTGGSRGIGRMIALELAREGADIVIAARTDIQRTPIPGTIGKTAQEIEALGRRALPVKTDLTRTEDIEALATKTLETFGRVDILVNNAAYTSRSMFASFWDLKAASWDNQFAVNVRAPFLLCKLLAPKMREQGGGLIINITSGEGRADSELGSMGLAYPTTKAALDRMTLAMSKELREANIAIVALDPGFTLTETAEAMGGSKGYDTSAAHSMLVPARAALYLATCPNPMRYTGRVVVAEELAKEHRLV